MSGRLAEYVRDRRNWPRLFLGLFCVVLFVVGLTRDGRSFESVDVRQYGEMMQGIQRHGLPIVDNGDVHNHEALRVPWNVYVNGHLWGTYAPLYPYLTAPLLAISWRLVWIFTFLILIPLALVMYALGKRVLDNDWYALLTALGTVASTPILGKALEVTAYPLVVLLSAAGTLATIAAIQAQGRRRHVLAATAGAMFALGASAHLLCFPLGAASLGVIAIGNARDPDEARGPSWLSRTPARGMWPTRETLLSAVVATIALGAFLFPMALLNHVRFGSWNPLSYGPTPWPGAVTNMNVGAHVKYAAPTFFLLGIIVVAWLVAAILDRKKLVWPIRIASILLVALALSRMPEIQERSWRILRMALMVTIDCSVFELEPPYRHEPAMFGNFIGPWVLKSTLQATPILALVLVLPRVDLKTKHLLVALLLPVFAFYLYLTMRANIGVTPAFGWAWVSMRYTLPALPMLYVTALVVVRKLEPTRTFWITSVVIALGAYVFLRLQPVDTERPYAFPRQILLLAVPVVLAVVGAITTRLAQHEAKLRSFAGFPVAILLGLGFAFGLGHDLPSHIGRRIFSDWKADEVGKRVPQRFAVFGYHWDMDQLAGLRMSRDIEYGDLGMLERDNVRLRKLIDHWFAEGRPIFHVVDPLDPETPVNPWPDLEYEQLDGPQRLWRLVKKP